MYKSFNAPAPSPYFLFNYSAESANWLLYTPCVAAIACVKRELGSRKAALEIVLLQCGIAWIVAFIIHTIGILLGIA